MFSRRPRGSDVGGDAGLIELSDEQKAVVETVRDFVDKEVIPVADELEHADEYPEKIVEGMKELGLFGLTVPEEYGGAGAGPMEDAPGGGGLARGWGLAFRGPQKTLLAGGPPQKKPGRRKTARGASPAGPQEN